MTSKQVLPTHTCFDDALDLLCAFVKERPRDAHRFYLVHGILRADDGLYSHAWLEEFVDGRQWHVWQAGILDGKRIEYAVLRSDWERAMRVVDRTRYTVQDAWRENYRTGHYGPWKLKYKRLCARVHEVESETQAE